MKYLQLSFPLLKILLFHGSMSATARTEVLRQFKSLDEQLVMIVTSVGSTGVNMFQASIMIMIVRLINIVRITTDTFMSQDSCWSEQEIRQLQGRVWRIGQEDMVIVYRILSKGTADILLNSIAHDKSLALRAFTQDGPAVDEAESAAAVLLSQEHSDDSTSEDEFEFEGSDLGSSFPSPVMPPSLVSGNDVIPDISGISIDTETAHPPALVVLPIPPHPSFPLDELAVGPPKSPHISAPVLAFLPPQFPDGQNRIASTSGFAGRRRTISIPGPARTHNISAPNVKSNIGSDPDIHKEVDTHDSQPPSITNQSASAAPSFDYDMSMGEDFDMPSFDNPMDFRREVSPMQCGIFLSPQYYQCSL